MKEQNAKKLVMVGISRKGVRGFKFNKKASLHDIKKFFPFSTPLISNKKIEKGTNELMASPESLPEM